MPDSPLYPDDIGATPDRASPPPTPRWVKVSGIIGLAVVLLIVIALATGLGGPGAHGPGRHLAGLGDHAMTASVTATAIHQP